MHLGDEPGDRPPEQVPDSAWPTVHAAAVTQSAQTRLEEIVAGVSSYLVAVHGVTILHEVWPTCAVGCRDDAGRLL